MIAAAASPLALITLPPGVMFTVGFMLLVLFGWYFASDSERVKRIAGTILTVLMTFLAVVSFVPPFDKYDAAGNRIVTGKLSQGIDLKGGTSFLIRLQPGKDQDGNTKPVTADMLDRAIEAYRKRVDSGGVGEPVIAPQPPDRIMIQLPGVDPDRVQQWRETLQKVAKLEFRMVHPNYYQTLAQIKAKEAILDPAYEILPEKRSRNGKDEMGEIIVAKKIEITGDKVTKAWVNMNEQGTLHVGIKFDAEGAKRFEEVTGAMRYSISESERDHFAIILDNVVISAPGLNQPGAITGGSCIITGNFTNTEARDLASALENPLENPVQLMSVSTTSASLGADAVNSGIFAGLLGAVITVVLTMLYYRFAGLVANLALAVFCAMLFGAMGMFGAVLTLPGVAGILLTLGMAIDANVLIYERLREEQAAGKSLKTALDAAYDKAFTAIFDSNITTLITAGILFWQATGPVKGFAVSLVIGVIASLFTALIVTRNLFAWGMHCGLIKRITMVNLIPATNFDFMGKRRVAIFGSLAIIVASVGIFAYRGEKNFGVDFKGGTKLVYNVRGERPPIDAVRASLGKIGEAEAVVQEEKSANQEFLVIRTGGGDEKGIVDQLLAKFPDAKLAPQPDERVLLRTKGDKPAIEAVRTALQPLGETGTIEEVKIAEGEFIAVDPAKNGADAMLEALNKALPTAQFQRISETRYIFTVGGTKPGLEALRSALTEIHQTDAQIEEQGDRLIIRPGKNRITKHLAAEFPKANLEEAGIEQVGSVVGKELARTSIYALLLGMVGILIYVTVRFELSFAIGALVALVHDVVITVGVFSLLGRELSLVIVGAILTIAGYSVNDTIVVFDRIREGVKAGRAGTITQIMNLSINETLSRTVLTGGITLITTIILYFFGGPVLGDFALTMLIGILVGTYSSIFIAAPVVLWWSGRGGRDLKSEVRKGDEQAVVPA